MSIKRLPQRMDVAQNRSSFPFRVQSATAADHAAILLFLQEHLGVPSASEFAAQLEAPQYEPHDRLLAIRTAMHRGPHGGALLGHLRLRWTSLRFGSLQVPCVECRDLVLTSEAPIAATDLLWRRARRRALDGGALLLLAPPRVAPLPRDASWFDLHETLPIQDDPRKLLARLEETRAPKPLLPVPGASEVDVRLWRRVELDALKPLHEQATQGWFGGAARADADWEWLIRRQAFDRLYAAVHPAAGEPPFRIAAYAVARKRLLLELCGDNLDDTRALLTRFCQDEIEIDDGRVQLDLHPLDSLRQMLQGQLPDSPSHRGWRASWLQPEAWLRRLADRAAQRAPSEGGPVRVDLSIRVPAGAQQAAMQWRMIVQDSQARLDARRLGRHHVACDHAALGSLLAGQPTARVVYSSSTAEQASQCLFPRLACRISTWEQAECLE